MSFFRALTKTLGVVLLCLILILLSLYVFAKTQFFRDTVKTLIEKTVSSSTNQTLRIESVEIDIFRKITLKNASFTIDDKPFIHAQEVSLKYSLPLLLDSSTLLSKTLLLKEISIKSAEANLIRYEDGSWNLERIGKERKKEKDSLEKKEPSKWSIVLQSALLKDIRVKIEDKGKNKTTEINIPEMLASLKLFNITNRIEAEIKRATLDVTSPTRINITGLSTKTIYTKDGIKITRLESKVNDANIQVKAELKNLKNPVFAFDISLQGYRFKHGLLNAELLGEGKYGDNGNLTGYVKVRIPESEIMGKRFESSLEEIKLMGHLIELQNGFIKTDFGQVLFKAQLEPTRILTKKGVNTLKSSLTIKGLDISKLPHFARNQPSTGIINGKLVLAGRWKDTEDIQINANIANLTLEGKKLGKIGVSGDLKTTREKVDFNLTPVLDKLNLALILSNETLTTQIDSKLNIRGSFPLKRDPLGGLVAYADIVSLRQRNPELGNIDIQGKVEIKELNLELDISSKLENLNLSGVLKNNRYKSSLNSDMEIKAFLPLKKKPLISSTSFSVRGKIHPSSISGIEIKEGNVEAEYREDILNLKKLTLLSDQFTIEAHGTGQREKKINLTYEMEIKDPSLVSTLFPQTGVKGVLKSSGTIQGSILNPEATFTAKVSNLRYRKSIRTELIEVSGNVLFNPEKLKLRIEGTLKEIAVNNIPLKQARISLETRDKLLVGKLIVLQDELRSYTVELEAEDLYEKEKNIEIKKALYRFGDKVVENREPVQIKLYKGKITIKALNLFYENNSITGNAEIDSGGSTEIALYLNLGNLMGVSEVLDLKEPIKGSIVGNLGLRGTLSNPYMEANINLLNIAFRDFNADKAQIEISYSKRNFLARAHAIKNSKDILTLDARANLNLNLMSIKESVNTAVFDIKLSSQGFELSPLASLSAELEKMQGEAVFNLEIGGSTANPEVNGSMRIQEAMLKPKSLKNEIYVTDALLEFQGQTATLKTLKILTNKEGYGQFNGEVNLKSLTYRVEGKLNRFLIRSKSVTGSLEGDIKLEGERKRLFATGDVSVLKAVVRIPELPSKELEDIKFVDEEEEEIVIEVAKEKSYFKENVGMRINISIPGNSWVKGQGANIEIRGQVQLTKEYGESVILTGNIDTVRGTYEFMGKLFRIEEGKISFRGTPQINPFLDLKASYRVSNVIVFVNISGTMKKPVLNLSSDPQMQETDILSYLVFGTSSDKLGPGQRTSLQEKAAEVFAFMAAGELKDIIGDKFGLDIISIKGGGAGFESTQIEIGKYLTEDLYVAYERGLTSSSTLHSATPEIANQVRVEYRIFDFLTLESNLGGVESGIDVFFNFNY